MSNNNPYIDILPEQVIRNCARQHCASGIRIRKLLGDVSRCHYPKLSDWMEKAKRELVLAGPKGRLP